MVALAGGINAGKLRAHMAVPVISEWIHPSAGHYQIIR